MKKLLIRTGKESPLQVCCPISGRYVPVHGNCLDTLTDKKNCPNLAFYDIGKPTSIGCNYKESSESAPIV